MKCHTCRKGWIDIDVAGEVSHDICPDCNGTGQTRALIIARFSKSSWVDRRGGFHTKNSVIPLIRESVPEAIDGFAEDMGNGVALVISPDLQDGDKCVLNCIVTSRDSETGYVDDWHWTANKHNEQQETT